MYIPRTWISTRRFWAWRFLNIARNARRLDFNFINLVKLKASILLINSVTFNVGRYLFFLFNKVDILCATWFYFPRFLPFHQYQLRCQLLARLGLLSYPVVRGSIYYLSTYVSRRSTDDKHGLCENHARYQLTHLCIGLRKKN